MHDVERSAAAVFGLVRGMQAMKRADDDAHRLVDGQALSAFHRLLEQVRDGLAFDVLHHQQELVVLRDHVERLHDVGMANARSQVRLIQELFDERRVGGETSVQTLDGDRAAETGRAIQQSPMDRGHTARRDLTEDDVTSDSHRIGEAGLSACHHRILHPRMEAQPCAPADRPRIGET